MAKLNEMLSDREQDVLELMAQGMTNREIAAALGISHHTVKVHARNIFAKLDVSSRTEASREAIRRGYIAVPGSPQPAVAVTTAVNEPNVSREAPPTPSVADSEYAGRMAESGGVSAPAGSADPALQTRQWRLLAIGAVIALIVAAVWIISLNARSQTTPSDDAASAAIDGASTSTAESQDISLGNNWFQTAPSPLATFGSALVAIGLDLYQIGGEGANGIVDSVYIFETTAGTWRVGTRKPTAVADAGASTLFGEIYVAGGRLSDGAPTAVVEAYSPANNAWGPVAPLPEAVSGSVTLSDGSFLYVIGGQTANGPAASMFAYDPAADSWRPLPPMSTPRVNAVGGFIGNALYVTGGSDGTEATDACEQFNLSEQSWQPCPAMLEPRAGAGAAVLFNRLYVIGGGAAVGGESGEFYDPESGRWQVVNLPDQVADSAWEHPGTANIERRLYVSGGLYSGAIMSDTFMYRPLPFQSFIPNTTSGSR